MAFEACMTLYFMEESIGALIEESGQLIFIKLSAPSGHGFKLSPVIGKILSELALDLPPSYDLSPFKIHRFQSVVAKL
jgi:hypothetical protein